jgi:hypothetical protein
VVEDCVRIKEKARSEMYLQIIEYVVFVLDVLSAHELTLPYLIEKANISNILILILILWGGGHR